jgi:hypothetical protein
MKNTASANRSQQKKSWYLRDKFVDIELFYISLHVNRNIMAISPVN